MKAISLIQPYATLIMLGYKGFETRSWSTKHRGALAIHASAGKPAWAREVAENDPHIKSILERHKLTFDTLPRGAILGECNVREMQRITADVSAALLLIDPVEHACGDYTPGRWAWQLKNVYCLLKPIPCKGALSLWEVPNKVEAQFSWASDSAI
jgi:hypothetical protein